METDDDFCEYHHRCDSMPDEVQDICKVRNAISNMMVMYRYIPKFGRFETVLYGISYCPYCGKRLEEDGQCI